MKKKIIILFILSALIAVSIFFFLKNRRENDNIITAAVADKMLYYGINSEPKTVNESDLNWYDMYVDYINNKNIYGNKNGDDIITWNDMKKINDYFNGNIEIIEENKNPTSQDFIDFYKKLLPKLPASNSITQVETAIAGTPNEIDTSKEWILYSSDGEFSFRGLLVKKYVGKTVDMLCCGREILSISVISDEAVFKNVWIESSESGKVNMNIYGIEREMKSKKLTEEIESVLADINLKNGEVTGISIKTDEISGMVQSVSDSYVEIQGYGKIPVDENFMIYDISGAVKVKHLSDVVVGYDLQKFVVAEGKVCGAVIINKLQPKNIRVLIKNTGYESIFHDNVIFETDTPCTIENESQNWTIGAGEQISLSRNSEYLKGGRIKITPSGDGKTHIDSITRGNGIPAYGGTVEISVFDDGLTIVNDIDIEEYLTKVVPSEMPVKYGVEALKVQAVCARSYAYRQLANDYYSMYGAQVDDSTQYQVYNNSTTTDDVIAAVKETEGKVLMFNDEIIQTYYYSTSCGATTDVSTWGSDVSKYPYYISTMVSSNKQNIDLTDENTFRTFIMGRDDNDYDSKCLLYRWEWDLTCQQLSRNFNEKLLSRYNNNPDKVLTKNDSGNFESKKIESIGTIVKIDTEGRRPGGALESIVVSGTKATVRIIGEVNIRQLINDVTVPMHTNGDDTSMSILPSAFCIFEPVYSGDNITGYKIIGGGYGHGIGMSQNAVYPMTQGGMSYVDILQFFYKGSKVKTYVSSS